MKTRITCVALISFVGAALTACDSQNPSNANNRSGTSSTTSTPSNSSATTPPAHRDTNTTTPNADNTARNKDDQNKTPLDQSNSSSDVKITAEIRKAIMDDKAMSTNAQNCKIITDQGTVTLRGPVDTQAEKDAIESKARAVVGVNRVDNQLEVKTP